MINIKNMGDYFNIENSSNINTIKNINNMILNCSNDINNPGLVPIEPVPNGPSGSSNCPSGPIPPAFPCSPDGPCRPDIPIITSNSYRTDIKAKAILFGLNYEYLINYRLFGCINDVIFMGNYIRQILNIETLIFTDDKKLQNDELDNTSHDGIIINLYKLALESYTNDLDFVWIHYSGHGYNIFKNNINKQGILPSDGKTKGLIFDDILHIIFSSFNPKTKILFICDACHSGTIINLNYSWDENKKRVIENNKSIIKSKMICISGCLDDQKSADTYNIFNKNKYNGALTGAIINILVANNKAIDNIFNFMNDIRNKLNSLKLTQYPELTSTYDLNNDVNIIPSFIKPQNIIVIPRYKSHYLLYNILL
jgi:hypothetical protein